MYFIAVFIIFNLFIINNASSIISSDKKICDVRKCPEIENHYLELGCKPIKNNETDCCPTRFDCPEFSQYNKGKCEFKGKSYLLNEKIPNSEDVGCRASCTCMGSDEYAKFNCADVDCPEHFEDHEEGCIRQYELKKCCAVNVICDEDEKKNLHKCYYDNVSYYEGEAIFPSKDKCYKCICGKGLDNSTTVEKNSLCTKITCGLELNYVKYIQDGCAPVYYGNRCCPFEWRCPKHDDVYKKSVLNTRSIIAGNNSDKDLTCNFGDSKLNKGDSVVTTDKCLTCTCSVPPMVHCTTKCNNK